MPTEPRPAELLLRWAEMSSVTDAVMRTHPGSNPDKAAQVRWKVDGHGCVGCACDCVRACVRVCVCVRTRVRGLGLCTRICWRSVRLLCGHARMPEKAVRACNQHAPACPLRPLAAALLRPPSSNPSEPAARRAPRTQVYSDLATAKAFGWSVRVHMALAPYRRALFAEAAAAGLPPLRPAWAYHHGDPQAQALLYQAYLGAELLYCPALDPLRAPFRDVKLVDCYLPGGPAAWLPVWTGSLPAGAAALACACAGAAKNASAAGAGGG